MVNKKKGRTPRLGLLSDDEKKLIQTLDSQKSLRKDRFELQEKKKLSTREKKRIREI